MISQDAWLMNATFIDPTSSSSVLKSAFLVFAYVGSMPLIFPQVLPHFCRFHMCFPNDVGNNRQTVLIVSHSPFVELLLLITRFVGGATLCFSIIHVLLNVPTVTFNSKQI